MSNEDKKYNAYGIRLEVLKNAKEMVWETWHMEKEELESRARFEDSSLRNTTTSNYTRSIRNCF
jgi:hypothetical protein